MTDAKPYPAAPSAQPDEPEQEWRCGRCGALPEEHTMSWRQAYECVFDPALIPVPEQHPRCSWSRLDNEGRATLCALDRFSGRGCTCRTPAQPDQVSS